MTELSFLSTILAFLKHSKLSAKPTACNEQTEKQLIHTMGNNTGFRVANVVLRFFELCSAPIVVGIIGWALHRGTIYTGAGTGTVSTSLLVVP